MKKIVLCLLGVSCIFAADFPDGVHYVEESPSPTTDTRELYLNLLKKCLIGSIYEDVAHYAKEYNHEIRINGGDWPQRAHTMIGMKRLDNIHQCLLYIIKNNIAGDCIETGVWRGGATIFMRACLKAYGVTDKKVWVADSFCGLPPTNTEKYPADTAFSLHGVKELEVSMKEVRSNFHKYDLLDNQVVFLKGWFSKTLPHAPIKSISLLRLDGDYYESTMDSLTNLYDKVSVGGFIIIDDFGLISCNKAVHDFRKSRNIIEPLQGVGDGSAFWQKLYYN